MASRTAGEAAAWRGASDPAPFGGFGAVRVAPDGDSHAAEYAAWCAWLWPTYRRCVAALASLRAALDRRPGLIWYVAAVVLGAAIFAPSGIDNNWDRRNYHIAASELFLSGETFEHVLIAGPQTFFNPIINVPAYLLTERFGLDATRLALIALHGLLWSLLGALVWRIVQLEHPARDARALGAAAAMGALSIAAPLSMSTFGTTFTDIQLAALVAAALLIRLPFGFRPDLLRGALAGAALGVAVGLKPTMLGVGLPFGLVFYAMLAALSSARWPVAREFFGFAAAAAAATLAVGGPWALVVFAETGNPVFPFYNQVFGSPFAPAMSMIDTSLKAHSFGDMLLTPWRLALGGAITSEIPLQDARFALFWYGLVPAGVIWLALRPAQALHAMRSAPRTAFLYLFFIAAYGFWANMSGIHRYILVLDVLVGFLLALPVLQLRSPIAALAVAGALIVGHGATMSRTSWGTLPEPADRAHQPSQIARVAETALVVLDDQPLGYLIDYFGPDSRFILRAQFKRGRTLDTSAESAFAPQVSALFARRWSDGVWYAANMKGVSPNARAFLAGYGWRFDGPCVQRPTWAETGMLFCRLAPITGAPSATAP